MKFNTYMQKKSSAEKLNESTSYSAINEAETNFLEMIMSAVSYAKAEAMLPKYKEAAFAADAELNKAKVAGKTMVLSKKIAALEEKKANLPREKKEAIMNQIEKIKDAMADLSDQAEARQNALNDKLTNVKEELDKEVGNVKGGLKELLKSKMTSISQEAKQAGLEAKTKVAAATGKKEREDKAKQELDELNKKHEETLKKIESGESDSEDDLKEVEGIEAVRPELENYLKVSKGMNTVKVKLNKIYAEAEDLSSSIDDSFDADRYISYVTEDDDQDLFEEKETGAPSPDEVRGKIMAGDKDNAKEKLALMKRLKAVIDEWASALEAQAEAKAAIWNKVKGKPSTKSVLKIAGANPDSIKEESDGTYTASELSPKWDALINKTDDSPLKKVEDTKAKIDNENVPELEKEGEQEGTGTGGKKAPAGEETTTQKSGEPDPAKAKIQKKLDGAKAALQKKKEEGKSDKVISQIQANIDKLQSKLDESNESEDYDNVLSTINEEIDEIFKAIESLSAPAPERKIVSFSDFMSRKSN